MQKQEQHTVTVTQHRYSIIAAIIHEVVNRRVRSTAGHALGFSLVTFSVGGHAIGNRTKVQQHARALVAPLRRELHRHITTYSPSIAH